MKKNFMCFIYVYFWNRKMDNSVLVLVIIVMEWCLLIFDSDV